MVIQEARGVLKDSLSSYLAYSAELHHQHRVGARGGPHGVAAQEHVWSMHLTQLVDATMGIYHCN